jgi:hypothetical protein
MLETIREYGRHRLIEAGDEQRVRRRHRDWYQRPAARFADEWMGPRQAEWASRWAREHPNLRAALEFCVTEPGEAVEGLRLATALGEYWGIRGYYSEARHWLDLLLSAAAREPTHERFSGLQLAATYAVWQGDVGPAQRLVTTAAELAEQLADETRDRRPETPARSGGAAGGSRYDGWHRHITLAMLAHAYLAVTTAHAPKAAAAWSTSPQPSPSTPDQRRHPSTRPRSPTRPGLVNPAPHPPNPRPQHPLLETLAPPQRHTDLVTKPDSSTSSTSSAG